MTAFVRCATPAGDPLGRVEYSGPGLAAVHPAAGSSLSVVQAVPGEPVALLRDGFRVGELTAEPPGFTSRVFTARLADAEPWTVKADVFATRYVISVGDRRLGVVRHGLARRTAVFDLVADADAELCVAVFAAARAHRSASSAFAPS
ncbi:hypothetical protein [Actinocorallia sp. A-T 12471]|uniref:hypothetical protein n=1 Tax=Actinocorallia sp. A-T 12471 TaxID=3089813 RepID=UPI0029CC90E0|nr:hypothetical protein [Actinocorallia sp. A-T 12471]MDX6744024.1 hypothetical protein [Actinocorallia sp. A-T 12471]